MESLVIGLSSQRMYRELFWHLAHIAPVMLLIFLMLYPSAGLALVSLMRTLRLTH